MLLSSSFFSSLSRIFLQRSLSLALNLLAPSVLLFSVGWLVYTRFFHPLSRIPGPFWASVSRYWLGYQVFTGKAEFVQRRLHEIYGPLVRIAPDEVSVSDPAAVKIIYGIKSGFTKTDFYPPFASGISPHGDHFAQQDEAKHSARRKLVNNIYSMSSVLESEQYIDTCTEVFLSKMAKFAEKGQVVDLGEWIQWYTFDVVGELFFGQQFGFMRDEHDFGNYILSLDTMMPTTTLLCVLPVFLRYFQVFLGLLFPSIRKAVEGFNEIRRAGKFWVDHRLQQMADRKVNRSDLLDKLFKVRQNKSDFDIPEIQNESVVAIFAGSDTTAIAIRSILYYLMKTPDAYAKLMEEINKADSDGRLSKPHVKYNEAIKLPYLVACCKEGIRMHPSVGLSLPRYVPPGGSQIAGRFFPAGSKVGISAPVLHSNTDIFGADAAVYNPDRWIRDPKAAAEMDRYMLHFGAGSRTCIGKNISLAEIHKMIPQLLRSFKLELVDQQKEWTTHNFWFNKQTGIEVRVTSRRDI
ncbi:cytochrome P450 [Aspergillus lucknowensis]|uniref:Cytochrome P450 n=1 Tax=Aspergillus lucknowensis TaxID=176173 RepID=A0ABR4LHU4_9EURO